MFSFFMAALWVVLLVAPLALLVALLPVGRDCPRCGTETLPIRKPLLRPVRRMVAHRWCTACGWEGATRHTHLVPSMPALEAVPEDRDGDDDAAWRSSGY
ncbi:MAG TPA: hypothetical protein VFE05_22655 [Longimicrobiaceae bacterium]|jgi:hypothetical protein|nr:hypothetical protein [Longimicrobiaceae bacterium]